MKKILLCLMTLPLFFLLQSCALKKDIADVETLKSDVQKGSTKEKCEAALTLAEQQENDAIPLLAELAENDEPELRVCALQALSLYREVGFCQDFYDIWLSDSQKEVRKAAGIALIVNDCESHITRRADYAMDSRSCGYTQYFINNIRDAIAQAEPVKEWKNVIPQLNIRDTIYDQGVPEEILQMRLNLAFAVIDWGESVVAVRGFTDQGSQSKTRSRYLDEIEAYTLKQEYIKQFCPLTAFPDFAFWNEVITGSKGKKD